MSLINETTITHDLEKLREGEACIIYEFQGGGAEVWLINKCYLLFEIPLYGGNPVFCMGAYNIKDIINKAASFT